MRILTFSLGQLQTNCCFLICDRDCLIIDPADDAGFILEELQVKKLKLVGILATHGHFDHIGAVGEIQKSFNVPFYISRDDLFLISRLNETAKYFLGFNPHFLMPVNIKYLKENNFQISNFKFKILKCPGHTPGGLSFYLHGKKIVFTGDTLFKQGIGRFDFSYSNKSSLKASLQKLLKLPEEMTVYSGHGEPTTIGEEKNILTTLY